jgi:hypothetical protein
MFAAAHAQQQDASGYYPPVVIPSQSSVYNQNSVYLPSPPIVHGQDIVRGASGMSCQSAVASGGPYLDVGLIGSQDVYNRDTAALYGRIVVPLGDRPDRPDCTKLYELEIARLSLELEMLRMGLPAGLGGAQHASAEAPAVTPAQGSSRPVTIKRQPSSVERRPVKVTAPVPMLKPKSGRSNESSQRASAGPL